MTSSKGEAQEEPIFLCDFKQRPERIVVDKVGFRLVVTRIAGKDTLV
ncbi:hypothetical protein Q0590_26655 [Rhodocytophaga aerolata]|uniref:Uncharacterized protein n=1 Tax=Rhodocytophaga aerolata TaxID=455078 RepID=A0ABT8REW3_9BACT|nr:hypothetical protein [Rhodocytophaga aerolata]MDO1449889.1 hypothetical protein [Rhodocytophaga aerolata]